MGKKTRNHDSNIKTKRNYQKVAPVKDSGYFEEHLVEGLCSENSFNAIKGLNARVLKNISEQKWELMTHVQEKVIPRAITGGDVMAAAPTGSGKTLAFVAPMWTLLNEFEDAKNGRITGLIITPTRELAAQILDVAVIVGNGLSLTVGLLIGGVDRQSDGRRIKEGMALCIATPGRLLDHIQNTKVMNIQYLKVLVIDEADRILTEGFRKEISAIIKLIPQKRQTMLFSATLTEEVRFLAGSALKDNALHVSVKNQAGTQANIKQSYIYIPLEERLVFLTAFLRKNIDSKIIVFFSSCSSVQFHGKLFQQLDLMNKQEEPLPLMVIHGKKKQTVRLKAFSEFGMTKRGVLFSTDVAARGLDLPEVDWVIQLDPPGDVKDYIHRVGRTARGTTGSVGNALLCLQPSEAAILAKLEDMDVQMERKMFNFVKYEKLKRQFSKLVQTNFHLLKAAKEAYKGFIMAYNSHIMKDCYDISELDLQGVASALGLLSPLNINLGVKKKTNRKKMRQLGD